MMNYPIPPLMTNDACNLCVKINIWSYHVLFFIYQNRGELIDGRKMREYNKEENVIILFLI